MKFVYCLIVAVCALGVTGVPAQAAPITYNEATDGDLAGSLFGGSGVLMVFALDVGSNTVIGTMGGRALDLDTDIFAFRVASGLNVTALSLSVGGTDAGASFTLRTGSIFGGGTFLDILGASSGEIDSISPALLPLLPGDYYFDFRTASFVKAPYVFTMTVAPTTTPVPEPASLTLLGLGLAGIGARRWRQRKAALALPQP